MFWGIKRVIIILIAMLIISGCSTEPAYAPVRDSLSVSLKKPTSHTVSKGETLYSIAWRYDMDYKYLARINGIDRNFHIYPGQKIRLSAKKQVKTKPVIKKRSQNSVLPKRSPQPKKSPRSIKATPVVVKTSRGVALTNPTKWRWPAKGKLTHTFRSNKGLHKGIDIEGKLGEAIVAAAAGRVVYSGEGLRGYGKLVILKHSEKYLSAYAHNKRLFVAEGDVVKQGERIALMGSTGTDSVKLHFQIRYDGKPVDPIRFLPKKR